MNGKIFVVTMTTRVHQQPAHGDLIAQTYSQKEGKTKCITRGGMAVGVNGRVLVVN